MKKFLLFLFLLIPIFNINALQLNNYDEGYNYILPDNCDNFFFYVHFGNHFLVCSSEAKYVVQQPYYNTGLGNSNWLKNYRVSISESFV